MVKVRDLVLSKGLTWSQICQSNAQSPQPDMVSPGAGFHSFVMVVLQCSIKILTK